MLPKLPYAGGTNGIDTHDTNRPDNDIKSFNSPYRERNVGRKRDSNHRSPSELQARPARRQAGDGAVVSHSAADFYLWRLP